VWEKIPYPELNWGEDQAWGWQIIQLGLKKAYAKNAVVYHSHNDPPERTYRVSKTEGNFFRNHFGIDLVPSEEEALAQIQSMNHRDKLYAETSNIKPFELEKQYEHTIAQIAGRGGLNHKRVREQCKQSSIIKNS
jgi:hypothetical protein